jgi:putative endonuclease
MTYQVYVIKSKKNGSLYKGYSLNAKDRLIQHNLGKSNYTSKFTPWELVYVEQVDSLQEAIKREKYLKSAAGRRFLKKMNIE